MADDGMLLNFSVGDGPLSSTPTFKGGRWKDRVAAKKVARHKQQRASARPVEEDNATAIDHADDERTSNPRPPKRQRVSWDPDDPPAGRRSLAHSGRSLEQNPRDNKPHQVVSSLFSFNPTPTSTIEKSNDQADGNNIEPSNAPLPDGIDTFTSLGLSPLLAAHLLTKLNVTAPTAIQKAAIPQLTKEDSDAFIQAETGSGKTLSYLLPLVQRIIGLSNKSDSTLAQADRSVQRNSGLFAIILAPTRELCKQISVVLESLLRCAHWIVAGTVIGGEKKKSEKARLRKGLNILVATPGRLADHLNNTEALDVSNVRWLVLDEGDRLMELGFEEEIQGIVAKLDQRQSSGIKSRLPGLPLNRTTVLCSATMKMNVQRLGEISLKEAVHIKADVSKEHESTKEANEGNQEFSAPAQLKQSYSVVPAKLRLVTLLALLKRAFARRGSVMKAIVFVSCADSVDFHFEIFSRQGVKVDEGRKVEESKESQEESGVRTVTSSYAFGGADNPVKVHRLHGSLPQHVRTATLSAYKNSTDPALLVCTDVASRGLDVPNVDYVIEYDPPFSKDDHLHRVGRTARAGKDGRALIFLLPGEEENYIDILKSADRSGGRNLVRHEVNDLLKKGFVLNGADAKRDWHEITTDWQLDVERWTLENPKYLEMARRAFQSHIRAYATHVAAERWMFNMKSLHLGHLAKSFGLRDKPGSIKVPGLRPGKDSLKATEKERRAAAKLSARNSGNDHRYANANDHLPSSDAQDAARKMRMKMKEHMSGASEFNIG
ncbi:MAG: ATP-dependent RNA helicase dbp7 [Sarea resinae]|nr:MAG: ATP-dependent RNA helicase dbp7 [Sarea resinae]